MGPDQRARQEEFPVPEEEVWHQCMFGADAIACFGVGICIASTGPPCCFQGGSGERGSVCLWANCSVQQDIMQQ